MEEAKRFVESFTPWDLFGGRADLQVDPEVEPVPQGYERRPRWGSLGTE
jgi:hypothetical protein